MEWRNRHLQSCSPVHAAAHHSYCRMYPTIHCSCPDTEKSIPTRHFCHYYLFMASIEMWHVVLLIVSETCVEWRNLGGFRSRVRCPCPQLAAAQWWEAAGRGISCSNYVRCIATLCLWFNQCDAHHQSFILSSELSINFQFWSAFHFRYYNVDSCVFFWDITVLLQTKGLCTMKSQ